MKSLSAPVAVFDSGLGGISVLREMVRLMPEENFIYYGDSANAPYGTKSLDLVRSLTVGHITSLLNDYGAKAAAIACNTATSAAVKTLRDMYPDLPLVGIEPAIKPAVLSCPHPRVLVMATPMTLKEEKFHLLEEQFDSLGEIYSLPCPGLMEYVERGITSGEELTDFVEGLLAPYMDKDITGIVLGCTHYPFLRDVIQKAAGENVSIFDGGPGTARELKRRLTVSGRKQTDLSLKGTVTFLNSSDDPALLERSKALFAHGTID